MVNTIDFQYLKKSTRSFNETVDSLSAEIEKNSFKVLYTHDVQATLAGKGIEHGPYKIIEFCRAPAAKKILDADPLIGLFLPCKAIVFEEDGAVTVSVFRPTVIGTFFPDAKVGELPEQIEKEIIKVVEDAVS